MATRTTSLPASSDTVAQWLASRALGGGGGSARRDIAAVRDAHILARLPDPTADVWLRRVVQGALRKAAEARPVRAARDALPETVVDALLARVPASAPESLAAVIALRDAALIGLGLSLMRRAAELVALSVGDVVLRGDEGVVSIRRSKMDQLGVGRDLPLRGGTVVLLRRWLAVRARLSPHCDHLFVNHKGGPLTTPAVGSIVKRAAALAGLEGMFSAHSMRIGGASMALASGASLAQIQAIGGWSSDAVLRYLRPLIPCSV